MEGSAPERCAGKRADAGIAEGGGLARIPADLYRLAAGARIECALDDRAAAMVPMA